MAGASVARLQRWRHCAVRVLVAAHHTQLEAQPALLQNTNFLKEKITLMCLTETLFQRIGPAADRSVSFDDIAVASKLPRNQVRATACSAPSPPT